VNAVVLLGAHPIIFTMDSDQPESFIALYEAAAAGDIGRVRKLIEAGVDADSQLPDGWTPLHAAVNGDHRDMVEYLLPWVSVDTQTDLGLPALHLAANSGYVDVLSLLIEAGAEVNFQDDAGWTALHKAVYNGRTDVVSALINAGANAKLQDRHGCTALNVAASKGHAAIVEILIVNLTLREPQTNGESATSLIAATEGHSSAAKLPIQAEAYLDLRDSGGWNSLHLAANRGHLTVVKILLAANPKMLDFKTKHGQTSLFLAAQSGCSNVVSHLLHSGAVVDAKADSLWTALNIAVCEGWVEVVRMLLDNQADSQLKLEEGSTALHIAARYGYQVIAEILINHNKNLVRTTDNFERTPLHLAVTNCHSEMIKTLLLNGADPNALDIYCGSPTEYASGNKVLRAIFASCAILKTASPPRISDKIEHLKNSLRRMTEASEHPDNITKNIIGHLLFKLGRRQEAVAMLSGLHKDNQGNDTTTCSFCSKRIQEDRFVCPDCADVDSCRRCMETYTTCPLDPCQPHRLIHIPATSTSAPGRSAKRRDGLKLKL
jgi:ankyrin repeat protein